GFGQSGDSIQQKANVIKSVMDQAFLTSMAPEFNNRYPGGFELFYPTAQNRCTPANETYNECSLEKEEAVLDAWSWGFGDYATDKIRCWAESIQGPLVGIIGFSTGASTALVLASLAERGASAEVMQLFRLDASVSETCTSYSNLLPSWNFKFAIFASGCRCSHPQYTPLFEPRIKLPVLHFIGEYDTYLPRSEMEKFSGSFENITTKYHPGAHFIPRYKECQQAMLDFITKQMRIVGGSRGKTRSASKDHSRGCCHIN
ncbi:hypothetical protein L207DRAFT_440465, partial [Hyaloscypha variabilis F]